MNKRDWTEILCRGAALVAVVLGIGVTSQVLALGLLGLSLRDVPVALWVTPPAAYFLGAAVLWFGARSFASVVKPTPASSLGAGFSPGVVLHLVVVGVALFTLLRAAEVAVGSALHVGEVRHWVGTWDMAEVDRRRLIAALVTGAISGALLFFSGRAVQGAARRTEPPSADRENPPTEP